MLQSTLCKSRNIILTILHVTGMEGVEVSNCDLLNASEIENGRFSSDNYSENSNSSSDNQGIYIASRDYYYHGTILDTAILILLVQPTGLLIPFRWDRE